jgi:hypothetical protein
MPRDLLDLAASAKRTADALPQAQARGVQKAALHTTRLIRAEIRSVTGDMRLSGVGKRGARVGAKFDIVGATNPTALITATGPIQLIERDVRAHNIRPRGRTKTARGRTRKGKKALTIGGGLYSSAAHPGTRGQHPFEHGVNKAAPDTPRIFQQEVRAVVAREWVA